MSAIKRGATETTQQTQGEGYSGKVADDQYQHTSGVMGDDSGYSFAHNGQVPRRCGSDTALKWGFHHPR